MILKEYGRYVGICDICGEHSPKCDTWQDCRDFLRMHWSSERDEDTMEWINICPDCKADLAR